jgi:hypothetical protein
MDKGGGLFHKFTFQVSDHGCENKVKTMCKFAGINLYRLSYSSLPQDLTPCQPQPTLYYLWALLLKNSTFR